LTTPQLRAVDFLKRRLRDGRGRAKGGLEAKGAMVLLGLRGVLGGVVVVAFKFGKALGLER
jgi:hypothetical protein